MPRTSPTSRLALSLIFGIMLLDVLGNSILYPIAAYIVRQYSSQALMVTLLSVIYSAAQFLAAPALGKLSDRLGRRPVLLVSLLGSALGYLMFGFGGTLWVLMLSRLVDGITGGNMSTASAYIVDMSEPKALAKNLTLIGLAWGLGLVLGPALGGVLGQVDLRLPAFCAAGFAALSMLLGYFWLPESLPPEKRAKQPMRAADFNVFRSLGELGRVPRLGLLLGVMGLFNFATNGMNSIESLFLIRRFDAQPWQIGLLLGLVGVTITLVQAALVRGSVSHFGETAIARLCLLLQAAGGLAVSFNPVFPLAYVLILLRSAAGSFIYPTLGALSAAQVSAGEQGALMGMTTALNSLTSIASPLLAGLLFDHWAPGAPYWAAAVLFAAAALLLRKHPAPKPATGP